MTTAKLFPPDASHTMCELSDFKEALLAFVSSSYYALCTAEHTMKTLTSVTKKKLNIHDIRNDLYIKGKPVQAQVLLC